MTTEGAIWRTHRYGRFRISGKIVPYTVWKTIRHDGTWYKVNDDATLYTCKATAVREYRNKISNEQTNLTSKENQN